VSIREVVKVLERDHEPLLRLVRSDRPYQFPKGYMRWETLSAIVTISLLSMTSTKEQLHQQDPATQFNSYRTALWFVQDAPIYCLSTQLLRAFEETDVLDNQAVLADLEPPLPTFLLLFPQNAIQTPEGAPLDYAVVHISDRAHPEWSRGSSHDIHVPYIPHEHNINLHWAGVDAKETVWFSGMGLEPDGTVKFSEEQLGADDLNQADRKFLARMRSLTIQCLLTLSYRPDLLDAAPAPLTTARSQSQNKRSSSPIRKPRWLGKDYRPQVQSVGTSNGSHDSPREHWRKAHWRRVAVGEGRIGRRWHWFEPMFVGGAS